MTRYLTRTSHCARRAGIQKMPNEILSEIFTYACRGSINTGDNSSPIWILQDVCTLWGEILMSVPKLWTDFEVEKPLSVDMDTVASRVQACLNFSRGAPLTIALPHFVVLSRDESAYYKMYIDIAENAHGIIALKISTILLRDLLERKSYNFRETIFQHGLRRLHNLAITGRPQPSDRLFDLFKIADALEEVELNKSELYLRNARRIPWAKLKRISFQDCSLGLELALAALSQMESLEVLTWKQTHIDLLNGLPPVPKQITLPNLHTFILEHGPIDFPPESCHISAPSLKDVHFIDLDCFREDIEECPFGPMIKAVQIKRLHLESTTKGFALDILKGHPSVEELLLSNNKDYEEILDLLRWNSGNDTRNPNLLPKLRKLEFCEDILYNDEFVPFVNPILRSRSSLGDIQHSLNSVTCIVSSLFEEDPLDTFSDDSDLTSFTQLGEELGIKVEVRYLAYDSRR